MYKKIFVPLMLINNNAYTFLSGIFVSLSVNIFTSLCFEKSNFCLNWFMYIASVMFMFTSVLCMYISAKLGKFQSYIIEKRISDYEAKRTIVLDATKETHIKWVIVYICILVVGVLGIFFLMFNFIVAN